MNIFIANYCLKSLIYVNSVCVGMVAVVWLNKKQCFISVKALLWFNLGCGYIIFSYHVSRLQGVNPK